MSQYSMTDGTVVKTENAAESWEEDTFWDGHNHVSVATGTQWDHETLHKSRKGRYWVERTTQWEGRRDGAEWLSPHEAARWLINNKRPLPEDLEQLRDEIEE